MFDCVLNTALGFQLHNELQLSIKILGKIKKVEDHVKSLSKETVSVNSKVHTTTLDRRNNRKVSNIFSVEWALAKKKFK